MKKTITVGIPAHNEAKNIESLLRAVLSQKGDNFIVKDVIVVCDGSTDGTPKIVKNLAHKYPRISVLDDGKRLGKSARLNNLYKKVTSDIFITFDADVTLANEYVISELVKAFANKTVGLVGGRVYPLPQKTLIGKILTAQEYFWSKVIDSINNGNNLQSHTGPISAASKDFLKTVKRPTHIVADDHFLYFSALENGFTYRSAKKAVVYINIPATFSDFMKQSTRFLNSADQIREHFGNWATEHYGIAYTTKLAAYKKAFVRYPLYMSLAIGLVSLQKILGAFYKEQHTNGTWTSVQSTK